MKAIFKVCNPAVVKNMMTRMDKDDFIRYARFIKSQAMELPVGTERHMYVKMYGWCRQFYRKKFGPLY